MEWVRMPERDTRIRRGDDYASDAWRHIETGVIKPFVVGYDPNEVWTQRTGLLWQNGVERSEVDD